MIFLGGATSIDSFLKAYKTSECKGNFPYQWFDDAKKLQNTELPPYDIFFSKLRSCSHLEAKLTKYVNLLKCGKTKDQARTKLKLTNRY